MDLGLVSVWVLDLLMDSDLNQNMFPVMDLDPDSQPFPLDVNKMAYCGKMNLLR